MPKSIYTIICMQLTLILFMNSSCQSKESKKEVIANPAQQANLFDIEAEKEKLKALCELATQRFIDRKSTKDFFWDDPKTQVIQKTPFSDEMRWTIGGKLKTAGGIPHVEANPNFIMEVIDRTDYVIEVTPQMAYVTYRQQVNWQDNPKAVKQMVYSHETRVFVKEGNDWKIALLQTVY